MVEEHDRLRQSFLRYVTGMMSEEELLRFEERLLGDHDFSDGAAVCEQELIDAFAANETRDADRAALQAWIEASPRRVERVRLSHSLRARAAHKVRSSSWMRLALPAAAVLAGLAVLTWFTGRRLGVMTGSAPETAAKNGPKAAPGEAAKIPQPLKPVDQVVLVLAERLRGQQSPQLLREPQKSGVMLQVLLPDGADNVPYRLQITRMDGAKGVLLDERRINPTISGDRLYLAARVAPGILTTGPYALHIIGPENSYVSLITVQESH